MNLDQRLLEAYTQQKSAALSLQRILREKGILAPNQCTVLTTAELRALEHRAANGQRLYDRGYVEVEGISPY